MALITCPECGKEVSDMAKMCPNCGYPINDPTVPDVKNNICVFKGQRYEDVYKRQVYLMYHQHKLLHVRQFYHAPIML